MHANTVQVGQDLVAEHVSFVNDDHRCDTLFQSTALDFTLDIVNFFENWGQHPVRKQSAGRNPKPSGRKGCYQSL